MTVLDFINNLNKYKPTDDELKKSLVDFLGNEYDDKFLYSNIEKHNYKIIKTPEYKDVLIDIVECTNLYGKGIGEISFVKELEYEGDFLLFGSTDKECDLFKDIVSGFIYSRDTYSNNPELKLIANTVDNLLECIIIYYKMDTEFIYRKDIFNANSYRQKFINILGENNAWYFNELVDELSG